MDNLRAKQARGIADPLGPWQPKSKDKLLEELKVLWARLSEEDKCLLIDYAKRLTL